MKSVKIISHCSICGFRVEWELNTNEHGFFQIPDGYCPVHFILLEQDIKGHIKSIIDEDFDGP